MTVFSLGPALPGPCRKCHCPIVWLGSTRPEIDSFLFFHAIHRTRPSAYLRMNPQDKARAAPSSAMGSSRWSSSWSAEGQPETVPAMSIKSRGFLVGDFCDDADQCNPGLPHTICNAITQRCECDPDFPIVVDNSICVPRNISFHFSTSFFGVSLLVLKTLIIISFLGDTKLAVSSGFFFRFISPLSSSVY